MADYKTPAEARSILSVYTAAEVDALLATRDAQIASGLSGWNYSGGWDASVGSFPSGASANDIYAITVAGTVDGEGMPLRHAIIALIDNPSTTTFDGNWDVIPYGDVFPDVYDDVTALLASVEPSRGLGQSWQAGPFVYREADPTALDHDVITAGLIKLYVTRPNRGYNLAQWGVLPGNTSYTAQAQAAIDWLLETDEAEAYLSAGYYKFTQLRLFNTSSSKERAQKGKLRLVGDGQWSLNDVYRGLAEADSYGTAIEIVGASAADDGLLLAQNEGTHRSTDLADLTVIYDGTGYAIDLRYSPFSKLDNVSVRVSSPTGKAVNAADLWGGVLNHCYISVDIDTASAVDGIVYSPSTFAGNLMLRDSVIQGFNNCFHVPDGVNNFANLVFENTWFQKFRNSGFLCEGAMWNVSFTYFYSESKGGIDDDPPLVGASNYIKIDPTGRVANLDVNGAYLITGSQTETWVDGVDPVMDFGNVAQAKISGIKYFRPWSPLLHIRDGDTKIIIDGIDVHHDAIGNLPTGPLYMITAESGQFPKVELNRATITDTTKLAWADPAEIAVTQLDSHGVHVLAPHSTGMVDVAITNSSAYTFSSQTVRPNTIYVTATGGGDGAVKLLPASGREVGETYEIYNSPDSTRNALLRNNTDTTTFATVAPGEKATVKARPADNQWACDITTFVVGP